METMDSQEIKDLCRQHTLYTWAQKQSAVEPVVIDRAEGIYFYTPEGKRYLDFNSQLMSVNIGHGDPRVLEAIKTQLDALPFAHPQSATAVRARVGKLLADISPENINTFFFTLGGAEANENAVRAARLFTGKRKIITRHRSYHGATQYMINLSGDPRRWPTEPAPSDIVRVMNPDPYFYSFGDNEEEKTARYLQYLEEVIMYENPDSIAAMMVETVIGSNGGVIPPKGYMQGLRALCDKYGILMICDEVMAGFGRTGKLYAFENFGIVPDIFTLAKGITSSYLPLGAVALSDKVAAYFKDHYYAGGLTYNSHPTLLAAAEANIKILLEDGLIENAKKMEAVVKAQFERLKKNHPTFKEGRTIGLFGTFELQKNKLGEAMVPYNGSSPATDDLKKAFDERGLFGFVRWNNVFCMPPLSITEEQLIEAFDIIDESMKVTHKYFEG